MIREPHPNPEIEHYLAALHLYVAGDGEFPLLTDLPDELRNEAERSGRALLSALETDG